MATSVKSIGNIISNPPNLSYDGQQVRIDTLQDKEIIVRDFVERQNKLPGRGPDATYVLVSCDEINGGIVKRVFFSTSSSSIRQWLSQAGLPKTAVVRKVLLGGGKYYWKFE